MKGSSRAKSSARAKTTKPRGQSPANPSPSKRQRHRLAADIVSAAQTPEQKVKALTHAEVEELLAWYISDERAGKNVAQLYPAVAQHLASCAQCKNSYSVLKLAFSEPAASQEAAPPSSEVQLPFLALPSQVPWYQEKASQLLGPDARVRFLLNPTHLKSAFAHSRLSSLRGAGETEESLVLDDDMLLGEQQTHVQVWLNRRAPDSDRAQVRVVIMSPTPLPEPLQLRLRWGNQDLAAALHEGQAIFENLAIPDFAIHNVDAPSRSFSLTLEPPAPPNAPSGAD